MPRLILKFENRVLKEYRVGSSATIGRVSDNTVIIDNPAVSSHHARVYREGDAFVIEDLESKNGTFVNGKHVTRHTLQNGDVVLVGKHTLVFDQTADVEPAVPEPMISNRGDTVFLDTKEHRGLLAKLRNARVQANIAAGRSTAPVTVAPAAPAKTGVLRVVAGPAEQSEYGLEARTSLIGKSASALVRLQGWFKPKVAIAIARNGEGYVATPFSGSTLINSRPLTGRHELKDGDVLEVSGLILEFRLKG